MALCSCAIRCLLAHVQHSESEMLERFICILSLLKYLCDCSSPRGILRMEDYSTELCWEFEERFTATTERTGGNA